MSDDLVKSLRDINKNYELARGVHVDIREAADRIEELEAKLAKAVRLMELSVELATWNTTLREDVIDFITELKGQDNEV